WTRHDGEYARATAQSARQPTGRIGAIAGKAGHRWDGARLRGIVDVAPASGGQINIAVSCARLDTLWTASSTLSGTLPLLRELQPVTRQLLVALLAFFVPATVRELPAFRRVHTESFRLAVRRLNLVRPIAGGEEIDGHGDLHHLPPSIENLVRSSRSRCDCDHKNAFFTAGAAPPFRQQKPSSHRRLGINCEAWRLERRSPLSRPGDCPVGAPNTRLGCIRPCAAGPPPASSARRLGARGCVISQRLGSPLGFALEDGFLLQAIVARETAHQRAVHPIVEHPAHVFPRDACHRGEVALGDFLPNEDAPLAEVTAERLGEVQHRARNASLHGEKVRG